MKTTIKKPVVKDIRSLHIGEKFIIKGVNDIFMMTNIAVLTAVSLSTGDLIPVNLIDNNKSTKVEVYNIDITLTPKLEDNK